MESLVEVVVDDGDWALILFSEVLASWEGMSGQRWVVGFGGWGCLEHKLAV